MAFVRRGLAAALLLAMVAGCGLPVPGTPGGTTAASTASPLTENASLPPTEDAGQQGQQGQSGQSGQSGQGGQGGQGGQSDQPSYDLAGLPMGNGSDDQIAPGIHCAELNYLRETIAIPPDVELRGTRYDLVDNDGRAIEEIDGYRIGGGGCSGATCDRVTFSGSNSDVGCGVPVEETPSAADQTKVTVKVTGVMTCRGDRTVCAEYRAKVERLGTDKNTLQINVDRTGPTSPTAVAPTETNDIVVPTAVVPTEGPPTADMPTAEVSTDQNGS